MKINNIYKSIISFRNQKRNFSLLISFLSLILLLQNCSDNPSSPYKNPGSITGVVSDSIENFPVTGADIRIINFNKSVLSDTNGYFKITNVPSGHYQLLVTQKNYFPDTFDVFVPELDTINLTIKLSILDSIYYIQGYIYKIMFSNYNTIWSLETINSDGTGLKNLTNNLDAWGGSWSPDGSSIAFLVDQSIYIMDSSGSSMYPIVNDGSSNHSVAWSPDGNQIVFISDKDTSQNVYIINKDGTNRARLTYNKTGLPPEDSQQPLWSPNGSQIAFGQINDNKCEIHIISKDGTNNHSVTNDSVFKDIVKWFPDGNRLLVNYNYNYNNEAEIYIVSTTGSQPIRLTTNNVEDNATDLSGDGSIIIFDSKMSGNGDIYKMNADGSDIINLTRTPAAEKWAEFSPDGKKIVFWSSRNSIGGIYLMDSEGKYQINLTHNLGWDQWPNWCPVPLIQSWILK